WEERVSQSNILGDLAKAQPNPGHYALAELEKIGILKCLITQNIDGLHQKAGSKNLLEYHGNGFKLRCIACSSRFERDEFDLVRLQMEGLLPPHCPRCGGLVKTDGVSFGEPIPPTIAQQSLLEARKCDTMLVCGTSAVVYPFANLPLIARGRKISPEGNKETTPRLTGAAPRVIIIERNAEPTRLTTESISDYLIQGKTGEVLPRIVDSVKSLQTTKS
ncbi:MAG: Sir2 family NAD-dependent protein deacetylase, partial [Dehalococcoidales bacterium]|nr:Sir2 family NAD-dependent protein deacetylase [Dehalococcoidales bacterium]